MKCRSLLLKEIRGKKYPKLKVLEVISASMMAEGFVLSQPRDKYEECDGDVKMTVEIEDDSSCSCCCDPSIRLEFRCTKCPCMMFPELLETVEMEDILDSYMSGVGDETRKGLMENYLVKHREREEKNRVLTEELRKRREEVKSRKKKV